jgi:hypothetical protein
MSTPTIPAGNLYMNATLYTGTSATQSVVNGVAGQSFQPDFIWTKSRANAYNNNLYDSVRGISHILQSNNTTAETTSSPTVSLVSIDSNGFTLGSGENSNLSGTSVGWQWKAGGTAVSNTAGSITSQVSANTTSGFSIVSYTGNGVSGATVGHGLGVAPSMIIVKDRTTAGTEWRVYFSALGASVGGALQSTAAFGAGSAAWNGTSPTSTVFSLSGGNVNASGDANIAYCWIPIAGYSAFGTYTGNGSADGPFIYTGFRPRFVMTKCTSTTGEWVMMDTSRSPYNAEQLYLYADASSAEAGSFDVIDGLSNGFKVRSTWSQNNTSGATYIYAAFAENPFKYANAR